MMELLLPSGSEIYPHNDGYICHVDGQERPILIVKVPNVVYQVCFEISGREHLNQFEKQQRIFTELKVWVEGKYPEYGIVNFLDLRDNEARQLSEKTKLNFSWGMYLVLQYGSEGMTRITQTNSQINNQSYGNEQIDWD